MDRKSRHSEQNVRTANSHRQSIERVIVHMRGKLADQLSLTHLARLACLSKFHFLRVFEEVTGTTPYHFLACLRIERAKELLIDSNLSVTSICMDVGYTSLGSFSASFRELVGLSPSAFRTTPMYLTPEYFFSRAQTFIDTQRNHVGRFIEGRLDSPCDCRGYFFVGAFTKGVPQGIPHSGIVMLAPGKFKIPAPVTPVFHLLAAVLPFSVVTEKQRKRLNVSLVASMQINRDDPYQKDSPVLQLRQPQLTDPPIVVSLSALLG